MKVSSIVAVLALAVLFALIAIPAGAAPSDKCDVRNPPGIGNDKPHDIDGDCLYEDIDGDGNVTILDTQALFVHMQNKKITNHPEAYDFSTISPSGKVTIFDVSAHWLKHVR